MTLQPFSARRLLILALVLVVCAVSAVAAGFSYRAGLVESGELFDAKLAHSARVLAALVDQPLADAPVAAGEPLVVQVWQGGPREGVGDALVSADGHAYETKLAFEVLDGEGRIVLRSDSGPDGRLAALEPGFDDVSIDGEAWRVFTLRTPRGLWVQAGERGDIRAEMAAEIAFGTMAPMLLALPVLALLVWGVVAWASRALARLSGQLERRAADALAPLAPSDVPEELRGLVLALNGLLGRLGEALERERRFTADAAHELRTPLAALRVHASNLRDARDAAEREASQAQLEAGMRRMERLVTQLLELARQEPGAQPADAAPHAPVAFGACVRRAVAEIALAGMDRGIDLEVDAPDGLVVAGDELALGVLVRNLVDNALRYTPEGGRVRVSLAGEGVVVRLRVEDSGPGIPVEARAAALARFHRGLGHAASGSGLGLSIVQRIVERHGGGLVLEDSPALGGLRVDVRLPTARAA